MTNPTSNFGWQMPTSTDLVTDLPADFETFGQAVDTSLAGLKGGTTGQVLSKTSNTDMAFTWVAQDDSNAIQNAIVDAKGDLIAASAADTPARLAVGNNGETLVADSSTSTGLRYQPTMAAGKNFIINGGFDVWQRSTSSATINAYATADRFYQAGSGTTTYSRDTDVPTSLGFTYSAKWLTGASSSYGSWESALESQDVNTLAGRTVTLSFYAKANATFSGNLIVKLRKNATANTLSGGSWSDTTVTTTFAPTTSWVRYQVTGTLDAGIAGLEFQQFVSTTQASGAAIWLTGIQLEIGSIATTFTRSGGTIQGELAACQRYYTRVLASSGNNYYYYTPGVAKSTTVAKVVYTLPMTMRTSPSTTIDYSGLSLYDTVNAAINVTAVTADTPTLNNYSMDITVASGLTQYRTYYLFANNQSGGYLGFSAEL